MERELLQILISSSCSSLLNNWDKTSCFPCFKNLSLVLQLGWILNLHLLQVHVIIAIATVRVIQDDGCRESSIENYQDNQLKQKLQTSSAGVILKNVYFISDWVLFFSRKKCKLLASLYVYISTICITYHKLTKITSSPCQAGSWWGEFERVRCSTLCDASAVGMIIIIIFIICYCYYYTYHYYFCFYYYNQPLREKHCCVGPDIQCPSQHLEIIMWGKNLSEQYYPFVKLRHPVVCAGLLAVQACSVLQERSHQVFVVFRDYDVVGLVLAFGHVVGPDLLDEGDCPAKGDRPCLWAHLFVPLLVVALLNSL